MPIKTTITADANPEALKASLALLDKYEAQLKKLYGSPVAHAPHIKAAHAASADLSKFMRQHEAPFQTYARRSNQKMAERAAHDILSGTRNMRRPKLAGSIQKNAIAFAVE